MLLPNDGKQTPYNAGTGDPRRFLELTSNDAGMRDATRSLESHGSVHRECRRLDIENIKKFITVSKYLNAE